MKPKRKSKNLTPPSFHGSYSTEDVVGIQSPIFLSSGHRLWLKPRLTWGESRIAIAADDPLELLRVVTRAALSPDDEPIALDEEGFNHLVAQLSPDDLEQWYWHVHEALPFVSILSIPWR